MPKLAAAAAASDATADIAILVLTAATGVATVDITASDGGSCCNSGYTTFGLR